MDLIIYPRSRRAIAIFGFIRISSLLFTDETLSRPSRPFRYVTPSRVGSLEIPSLLRHPTCLIYLPQGGLASPSHTSIRAYPCDLLGKPRHHKLDCLADNCSKSLLRVPISRVPENRTRISGL